MGVIRAPEQVVDPDVMAKLYPQLVLLEPDEDVAAEEVAGQGVSLEPVAVDPHGPLQVEVVHPAHEVGGPGDLELHHAHLQLGVTLEYARKDHPVDTLPGVVLPVGEVDG